MKDSAGTVLVVTALLFSIGSMAIILSPLISIGKASPGGTALDEWAEAKLSAECGGRYGQTYFVGMVSGIDDKSKKEALRRYWYSNSCQDIR
jgi:hypothetical protein